MYKSDNEIIVGEESSVVNIHDSGKISISTYIIFFISIIVVLAGLFLASYKSGIVGAKKTSAFLDFSTDPAGKLVPLERTPDTLVVRDNNQLKVRSCAIVYHKTIGDKQSISVEIRFGVTKNTLDTEIPMWAGPILAVSDDGSRFAFALCLDNVARIYYISPLLQEYYEIASIPFDVSPNDTYLVETTFNSKDYSFRIDGEEIMNLDKSSFEAFDKGRFAGIEVFGGTAYFDDLAFN